MSIWDRKELKTAEKALEWWPGGERDDVAKRESATEIKTYLIQLACPKCSVGELHYQEDANFSSGSHTHVCDNDACGWMVGLKSGQYPAKREVAVKR